MGRSNHQSVNQTLLNDGSFQRQYFQRRYFERQFLNVHSSKVNSVGSNYVPGRQSAFKLESDIKHERSFSSGIFATLASRIKFYSGLPRFLGQVAMCAFFSMMVISCGSVLGSKKDSSEASRVTSNESKPILQTTISETSGSIFVKLVQADSSRLMERLMVKKKMISVNQTKLLSKSFTTKDGSLNLACQAKANTTATENCVLKITKSEGQTITSIVRDPLKIDQTITMGSSLEAKKLYESLNLKEWDLGASKMIRFASFDNRFILECSKSETVSRCQIFLSDGSSESDGSSDD